MEGGNRADTIVGRSRGTRNGVIVRREQHRIRLVFVGTRDLDEDIGSLEICPYPGAGTVHDGRIEVVDDFDVRVDGFDS